MTQQARFSSLLEQVSLVHVFLPCYLFVLGWLRWYFAIPSSVVLALGVFAAFRALRTSDSEDAEPREGTGQSRRARIINEVGIIALAVLVVAFSGMGGFAHQVPDYAMKHNSFLKDFIESAWPIGYVQRGDSASGPLVTYFAFYLPHAAVDKLMGWRAANLSSLLWTMLGVYLCVAWFLRLVGSRSVKYAVFFLFFNGLDTGCHRHDSVLAGFGHCRARTTPRHVSELRRGAHVGARQLAVFQE
ncbi:MAG TPA: hypothetical protein PKI11_20590 [Candidatus Hydrogenedentes bacterium]|nr:hypothetical protein [Candidatus Hydrogenedentota bacterium]HNT89227.1 hypothetical protein [Candidatus Hydrogenedentota bacterium]